MDPLDFFELCSVGDSSSVKRALDNRLVDVNYQHKINGWTALHWASRRGHKIVVQLLLKYGADQNLIDSQGRSPKDVASDQSIIDLLGGPDQSITEKSNSCQDLPIVPNYLRNPPFLYAKRQSDRRSEFKAHSNDKTDKERSGIGVSSMFIFAGSCAIGAIALGFLIRYQLRR